MSKFIKNVVTILTVLFMAISFVACVETGVTSEESESVFNSTETELESETNEDSIIESEDEESQPEEESEKESEVESEKESESIAPEKEKTGEIFIRLHFTLTESFVEQMPIYEDSVTLDGVFAYIMDKYDYAEEISLSTFAVYNYGALVEEDYEFIGYGNALCIIKKDLVASEDEEFEVTYSGVDQYGCEISGTISVQICTFSQLESMLGFYYGNYYYTVYGSKMGGIGADEYMKYDYNASMIFASTEIVIHPIIRIEVQMDYGYYTCLFEEQPSLSQVIESVDFGGQKDDYVWFISDRVVEDYNELVPMYAENTVSAKAKKIGAYISFVDEMGYEMSSEPYGENCPIGDSVKVSDLVANSPLEDGNYTLELVYVDKNGNSVSKQVSLDDTVEFVYTSDFEYYGYYRVEIYGKNTAFNVNVSGWMVDLGDFYFDVSYNQEKTVGEIFSELGLNYQLSDMYVTVNYRDHGEGVDSLDYVINKACSISISEQRLYLTVQGIENGSLKTVNLLMPQGVYTVGEAISDAGFTYEGYYWEVRRYNNNNLYYTNIPVSSADFELIEGDVLKAKVIESVTVNFDCYEVGYVDAGDGLGFKTYSLSDKWDNPQLGFYGDANMVFVFEGWAFEKFELRDMDKAEIITSLDEIFAKNAETVTVYPVYSVNYDSIKGWFYFGQMNAYINFIDKNTVLVVNDNGEYYSSYEIYNQSGAIYATISDGGIYNVMLDFYGGRVDGPIIRIIVDDDRLICSGTDVLYSYLSDEYYMLVDFSCDGEEVSIDDLEEDKCYVAYFRSNYM